MRRLISLVLVFAFVVAACSPSTEEGAESTTTSSPSQETTTTAGTAETTTTGSIDEPTTTQGSTGGEACLVGTWVLDTESFVATMTELFGEAGLGGGEIVPAEGTYTVTLNSDGSLTGERDDWGFSVATPDGTVHMRINGSEMGPWSADDSTMTVSITSSDVTVTSQVEVDGQLISMPTSPVEVPEAIAEQSSYSCDNATLAVTSVDVTIVMNRA